MLIKMGLETACIPFMLKECVGERSCGPFLCYWQEINPRSNINNYMAPLIFLPMP
jgi:hypothetical protein